MATAESEIMRTVARLLVEDRVAWFVDLQPFSTQGELTLPIWNRNGWPTSPCWDVLSVAVPLLHLRDIWRFRQDLARTQGIDTPDLDALVAAMTAQPDDHEVAILMICIDDGRNAFHVFFDVSSQSVLGHIPFAFPTSRHDPDGGSPGPAAQHGPRPLAL